MCVCVYKYTFVFERLVRVLECVFLIVRMYVNSCLWVIIACFCVCECACVYIFLCMGKPHPDPNPCAFLYIYIYIYIYIYTLVYMGNLCANESVLPIVCICVGYFCASSNYFLVTDSFYSH